MDNLEKEIQIRLVKVKETSFFLNSSLLEKIETKDLNNLQIGFGLNIKPEMLKNTLNISLIVKYQSSPNEDDKILEIETSNIFEIIDMEGVIENKGDKIEDKAGITPTLVGIAIGTIRGILVAKMTSTPLEDYPLPIVNPTELCNNLSIPSSK